MAIRKRTWRTGKGERSAWVVDYKDQSGNRRTKTFKTKKSAESWATTALYEVVQGTHTPDSTSVTVAEAAALWLERGRAEALEPATIRQYETHVKYHINPLVGDVKLSRLTAPLVEQFRDQLLSRNPPDGRKRSRAMAQKAITSLKAVLSDAQRRGLVAQNVALSARVRRPTRDREPVRVGRQIPSKEEVRRMVETATGRWRPLIVAAVFTGLRASELRALSWQDVDFDERRITVRQRADRWNQVGRPKSAAGHREIPMSPLVVSSLKEWKLACPVGQGDLVFPNGRGHVEYHSNIYKRGLAPLQLECGIVDDPKKPKERQKPKYGLHACRHFAASWFIEQGFPPKRVQAILGHSSIQMTFDVYGHLFPPEEDDHARLALAERAVLS